MDIVDKLNMIEAEVKSLLKHKIKKKKKEHGYLSTYMFTKKEKEQMKKKNNEANNAIVSTGKGIGQPRWEYYDSRGVKHYGWVEKTSDKGGTDVTYFFRDEKTNELSVVSGSVLKKANRIWK